MLSVYIVNPNIYEQIWQYREFFFPYLYFPGDSIQIYSPHLWTSPCEVILVINPNVPIRERYETRWKPLFLISSSPRNLIIFMGGGAFISADHINYVGLWTSNNICLFFLLFKFMHFSVFEKWCYRCDHHFRSRKEKGHGSSNQVKVLIFCDLWKSLYFYLLIFPIS